MPYYGRRRYRRRRPYRRRGRYMPKSYIKSKTGNRSQANQIVSLQRQIRTLNTKTSDSEQYVQYLQQLTDDSSPITLTSGVVTCLPLVDPKEWVRIFQS